MGLMDKLWGKRPKPRGTTTEQPAQTRDEAIIEAKRSARIAAQDLIGVLTGRSKPPVHVCREGHPIKAGDSICSYGHASS